MLYTDLMSDDHVPGEITDLVALVYRADWTALSLAAEVAEYQDCGAYRRMHEDDGIPATHEKIHHLLLVPGGCFRQETRSDRGGLSVTTSDGNVTWDTWQGGPDELDGEEDDVAGQEDDVADEPWAGATGAVDATDAHSAGDESRTSGPARPPLDLLLCPAWLPAEFELELAGSAVAAGRRAQRVIGRRRPVAGGSRSRRRSKLRPAHRSSAHILDLPERIDALVDADLGILLRCERIHGGQVVSRLEMTSITLEPPEASDADQFTPPADAAAAGPGWRGFDGPGWERLKTAADLGASAMSFAMRHAPRREPPVGSRPDAAATPGAGGGGWTGQPAPDAPLPPEILALIYGAGLRSSEFDAELRTWGDSAAAVDAFKWATRNMTLPGVTRLGEAMGELARPWQRRESIRIGLPDRFRIDYIDGGMKRPTVSAEATDGAQRWRVFPGHVGVGPAQPLPARIARLVDPAWMLDWRLTGGAEVIEGGRRGLRIRIAERWQASHSGPRTAPVEAVIDQELGILLRLTQEQDGRPAKQQVLADLRLRERRDASDFTMEIPIGTRVVQDTGGLTDQLDMPAPIQTAVQLAGKAFATAARVGSFLDSVRRQGKGNPEDRP